MSGQETLARGGVGVLVRKKFFWRLYIGGLAILSLVSINFLIPGSPIKCVQCSSSKTPECYENPPAPRSCDKDMKFCRITKETLTNGTLLYVSRDCVVEDTGDSCTTETPSPSTGVTSTTCHYTCNSDGCNGSINWKSSSGTMLISIILLHLWYFRG